MPLMLNLAFGHAPEIVSSSPHAQNVFFSVVAKDQSSFDALWHRILWHNYVERRFSM